MSLELLAAFIQKSGLRKVGSGLSMFGALCWLLYVKALPAENFTSLGMVIIVTLMGANAFEHSTRARVAEAAKPAALVGA